MKKTITLIALAVSLNTMAQIPTDSLSLWLRADIGVTTSGTDVTQWDDQSGNSRNAVASGLPQLIPNELCGKPVIRFNGAEGFVTPSFQTFANKRGSLFIVAKGISGSGSLGFGTLIST